jgi:hypothetical protein
MRAVQKQGLAANGESDARTSSFGQLGSAGDQQRFHIALLDRSADRICKNRSKSFFVLSIHRPTLPFHWKPAI